MAEITYGGSLPGTDPTRLADRIGPSDAASTPGEVVDACIFGRGLGCADRWQRYSDGPLPFLLPAVPIALLLILAVGFKYHGRIGSMMGSDWNWRPWLPIFQSSALGMPVAAVLGYVVYALPNGAAVGVPFSYWLVHPIQYGLIWWIIFGAAMGAAFRCLRRL